MRLPMGLTGLIALACLMTGGCTWTKYPGPEPGCPEDSQMTEKLVHAVAERYPDRFNILHHVGLSYQGRTVILKGFLKVDRKNRDIHLVAQAEMGGSLFDIRLIRGQVSSLSTNGSFKKSWLEKTVVRDLKALYAAPEFQTPGACVHDGIPMLSDVRDGQIWEYLFTSAGKGMVQLAQTTMRHGEQPPEYSIEYSYRTGKSLPGFITIEDRKTGYTLNINVRYIPPSPED